MPDKPLVSQETRDAFKKAQLEFKDKAEAWWSSLSYEQREFAFYTVTNKIHKADVEDQGSYRYTLYDIFDFDISSYLIGIWSGYMDIHNLIYKGINKEEKDKH